ncbi:hypothetical protein BKA69DRAFT_99847 [Paraphysoderma sedebokerense]|nr:hypothetical protein BKA69DRAFT_99847 [Paraphysoderma sedebokerense]
MITAEISNPSSQVDREDTSKSLGIRVKSNAAVIFSGSLTFLAAVFTALALFIATYALSIFKDMSSVAMTSYDKISPKILPLYDVLYHFTVEFVQMVRDANAGKIEWDVVKEWIEARIQGSSQYTRAALKEYYDQVLSDLIERIKHTKTELTEANWRELTHSLLNFVMEKSKNWSRVLNQRQSLALVKYNSNGKQRRKQKKVKKSSTGTSTNSEGATLKKKSRKTKSTKLEQSNPPASSESTSTSSSSSSSSASSRVSSAANSPQKPTASPRTRKAKSAAQSQSTVRSFLESLISHLPEDISQSIHPHISSLESIIQYLTPKQAILAYLTIIEFILTTIETTPIMDPVPFAKSMAGLGKQVVDAVKGKL